MKRLLYSALIFSLIACAGIACLNSTNGQLPNPASEKPGSDNSRILNIAEPSGLSFTSSKDGLYTVSDKTGRVYRIDFNGEVTEKLPFEGHDLEGIDVDKTNGDIWVVEEKKMKIYHLDRGGRVIDKISDLDIKTKGNSGFEGIAINGSDLYLLIEKDPGMLVVYDLLSRDYKKYGLSFAKDYSGVDYDATDNTIWIVSDESKTLNHCNPDGTLIKSQKIDIMQAEGVAVDRKENIAWIISDKEHRLYRIKLEI